MRALGFLIVLFFLFGSLKGQAQDLDVYQWKNRVILLKDSSLDSDWLQAQLKRLKSNAQELLEREVVLFLVNDKAVYDGMLSKTELQADSIITKYELSNFEGLVLIGKDGTTKLKEEFIVHTSDILELIDSMPMRIREIETINKID